MATLRQLLPAYLEREGLPPHGGQDVAVDWFPIFSMNLPIPNPPARKYILTAHDAQHLVTGFHTDWQGEAEVAMWALGAEGHNTWLAITYDTLGALPALLTPKRAWAAFQQGYGCRTLYEVDRDVLLDADLDELRRLTRTDAPKPETGLYKKVLRTLMKSILVVPLTPAFFVLALLKDPVQD